MKKIMFLIIALVFAFLLGRYIQVNESYASLPQTSSSEVTPQITPEELAIENVVKESLPSVVTVRISTVTTGSAVQFDPFNPFSTFKTTPRQVQQVNQNIGSGFIVSPDGLIITSKHVVSDTSATYKIITNDNKTYNVEKIYRDPSNDVAILKINPPSGTKLTPLSLGDSTNLTLGQTVIAIGTPLGEFTNTVTSGIISGLGRGITAGSPFQGYVEKLDNVIQTDVPINPGNSGGPLLNSSGQVIGINTAIAQNGQNIGFSIPVNVIKMVLARYK